MKIQWVKEGSYELDAFALETLADFEVDPETATGDEILEALDLDQSGYEVERVWVTR